MAKRSLDCKMDGAGVDRGRDRRPSPVHSPGLTLSLRWVSPWGPREALTNPFRRTREEDPWPRCLCSFSLPYNSVSHSGYVCLSPSFSMSPVCLSLSFCLSLPVSLSVGLDLV